MEAVALYDKNGQPLLFVASGSTDSGGSVKVGGRVLNTSTSLADGVRSDLLLNRYGSAKVDWTDRNGNIVEFHLGADGATNSDRLVPVRSSGVKWNGTTWDRDRTAYVFKPVSVAITAGTPQTVWTPASGKKVRVMGYLLSGSAGGRAIVYDGTGSSAKFGIDSCKSATNGIIATPNIGNGPLSAAANNVVQLDTDTTGTWSGFIFGTEE